MRKRREKGLAITLIIIGICLFLIVATGGPFSMLEPVGETVGDAANLLDSDISVSDSLGISQEEDNEDSMAELAFLVDHFSFERSGSQILIAVAAGILVLYLILMGPVLYFYLKKIRKMERMWLILPAVSIGFGCIILLMSNDFVMKEPFVDVIKVVSPGKEAICYGASTSPGEDSYRLYFGDRVKELKTWELANNYVIDEDHRYLAIRPSSAFEKEYFQYSMGISSGSGFVHDIYFKDGVGTGVIYNTTGYAFSHVLLCYEDRYCLIPALKQGEEYQVTEEMWKRDEYGLAGNLKEEVQLQAGLSIDEKEIFQLVWYRHCSGNSGKLHIGAVSEEIDAGIKDTGLDLIGYTLFFG